MKKIKYLLTFIFTLIISCNIVLANSSIVDFSKTGTIEITMNETTNAEPIIGAEITLYQVATATTKNHSLAFEYHQNLQECSADLTDLTNATLSKEIEQCIKDVELPSQIKITNQDGKVKFENLQLGLYLVKETNKVPGYTNIDSFLVTIPKIENNQWIYDIKSLPKTDIIRIMDLTVEKIWNNSSKIESHPKSVTIELYKENELIDTITLNKENNWIYTWKDLVKSDKYNVKEINIPDGYTVSYRQEDNKFIVTNTKTLVQTGLNLWLVEIITLLGLISLIIGIILEKRNKYE